MSERIDGTDSPIPFILYYIITIIITNKVNAIFNNKIVF